METAYLIPQLLTAAVAVVAVGFSLLLWSRAVAEADQWREAAANASAAVFGLRQQLERAADPEDSDSKPPRVFGLAGIKAGREAEEECDCDECQGRGL